MAKTNAQSVRDYQKEHPQIIIRPTKEHRERIKKAAANAGESVQKFILTAVDERMERIKNNAEE